MRQTTGGGTYPVPTVDIGTTYSDMSRDIRDTGPTISLPSVDSVSENVGEIQR